MLIASENDLVIRTFEAADICPDYLRWLNDPDLMKYSNQRLQRHTVESCQAYLDSFKHSANQFLAIADKQEKLKGTMTIYASTAHGTADLGILIGREYSGHGLGTRSWQTVIAYLEEQTHTRKITAGCANLNHSMIRLAEGSGMVLEGRRLQQEIHDGVAVDILLYGKIIKAQT
jgi:ribosomal-protein-alanine N-acetyltransferase